MPQLGVVLQLCPLVVATWFLAKTSPCPFVPVPPDHLAFLGILGTLPVPSAWLRYFLPPLLGLIPIQSLAPLPPLVPLPHMVPLPPPLVPLPACCSSAAQPVVTWRDGPIPGGCAQGHSSSPCWGCTPHWCGLDMPQATTCPCPWQAGHTPGLAATCSICSCSPPQVLLSMLSNLLTSS